ncbi:MAG: hypothetical protein V4651_11035 [Bacteroidota bacterium]
MKKIIYILSILGIIQSAAAQIAWVEPDPTIATSKITIYVDISKLDMSKENNQLLAANPGPMYLWTWKPFEFAAGSPKANGIGEKAWKNSNELLKMTPVPDKGPKVWMYEMIPTEFYEVSATQVYSTGISFLVKPKDGGGYGDPDIKSDDISIPITPPKTDKGAVYIFPSVALDTEIATIVYDNAAEKKATMKNLPANSELYVYLKATAKDTATGVITTYQPSSFFQVINNPNLKLENVSATQWKLYLIPKNLFGIPDNLVPQDIEILVRKKDWISDDDTSGDKPNIKFGCN